MLKKIFDLTLTSLLAPVWLPIIGIVMIFSFIFNGRPIFFFQDRGGHKGKRIKIIKFRTLDSNNGKINTYSNFLRFTKIDELPQLINVLMGEVSLVGPRPLFYEYRKLYKKKHNKRFSVKPGITGWSQIKSNPKMSWSKKFEYDIWYVKNRSFFLDLKIIMLTLLNIVKYFFDKNKRSSNVKKFNGDN
jgi:sugar transferase EpsL